MLISDTEKQKSTGTVYSRGTFDSREDVGCANLLRQVSFKFYNTLKEKKKQPGRSNKAATLWASHLPN